MCSQKRSRRWIGRGWLAGTLAVGLAAAGCTPDYVTGNSSPVNLYVTAVTGSGSSIVIDSDIRIGEQDNLVCPDFATVTVGVRNKNPRAPAPAAPSAVIVDSYVVRYFRTDGRGVEGVDIPFRITGYLTVSVDVSDSATTDIPIEIVRRQAKNEPPISMIQQTAVLSMFAEVTIYGTTIAGERVSDSGRVQIDFANYVEKLTACPGQ